MANLNTQLANLAITNNRQIDLATRRDSTLLQNNPIRVLNVPKEQVYTVQFRQLTLTQQQKENLVDQLLIEANATEDSDVRWPTPNEARISTRKIFHDFTNFTTRDYPLTLVANNTLVVDRKPVKNIDSLYIYRDGTTGRRFGQLARESGRSRVGYDKYNVVRYRVPNVAKDMADLKPIVPDMNVCEFLQRYFDRRDFFRLAQKEDFTDNDTRGRTPNLATDIKNARELLQVLVGLKVELTYIPSIPGVREYKRLPPGREGSITYRIITLGLSARRQTFRYETRTVPKSVKDHYETYPNLKYMLPERKLMYPDLPVAIVGYKELEKAAGARSPICIPLECLTIAPYQAIMKGLDKIYIPEPI